MCFANFITITPLELIVKVNATLLKNAVAFALTINIDEIGFSTVE